MWLSIHMRTMTHFNQKGVSETLSLGLQTVVNCPIRMLGTNILSSGRARMSSWLLGLFSRSQAFVLLFIFVGFFKNESFLNIRTNLFQTWFSDFFCSNVDFLSFSSLIIYGMNSSNLQNQRWWWWRLLYSSTSYRATILRLLYSSVITTVIWKFCINFH